MSVEKKMLTFWEMNILSSKIEETFRVTDCGSNLFAIWYQKQ